MKSTNYRSNWNINRNKSNTTPLGWIVLIVAIAFILYVAIGATENYSEGERIGFITKFSKKGRFWKSWEGELNLTQTGMNTSSLFDFSLDNDTDTDKLALKIDSAVNNGWKVKLTYHQVFMKNWFSNRGETDYFMQNFFQFRNPQQIKYRGAKQNVAQSPEAETLRREKLNTLKFNQNIQCKAFRDCLGRFACYHLPFCKYTSQ
jgi:hypothetical protein